MRAKVMQLNHLHHLARATAGIANASQFILSGTASLLMPLGESSEPLKQEFDELDIAQVIVADNIDPEGTVKLLNSMLGRKSSFYRHFGYGIEAVLSWDKRLPTNWVRRIVSLNTSLRYTPSMLAISPTDLVLGNMIQNTQKALNMELVRSNIVEIRELRQRTENWKDLSAQERMSIYTQTQELEELSQPEEAKSTFLPFIEPFNTEAYTASEENDGKILSFKRARAHVLRT